MSQKEYLKTILKELERINRKIDLKILHGEEYKKEARDHKLLLKKVNFIKRQNMLDKFFTKMSAIPRMTIF